VVEISRAIHSPYNERRAFAIVRQRRGALVSDGSAVRLGSVRRCSSDTRRWCAAIVAANTSMRPVEVKHVRRCEVDLVKKLLHVRRSKNESSHRVIPLNTSALNALARMFERADMLGHTDPEHYLWPACQWGRFDPRQPMLKRDTAWRATGNGSGDDPEGGDDAIVEAIIEVPESVASQFAFAGLAAFR
jgi:integrase